MKNVKIIEIIFPIIMYIFGIINLIIIYVLYEKISKVTLIIFFIAGTISIIYGLVLVLEKILVNNKKVEEMKNER